MNPGGWACKPRLQSQDNLYEFLTIVLFYSTIVNMHSGHRKTLGAIFKKPVPADIPWADIERLFAALGGELSEGAGSRLRVKLNGVRAVFHRPHPQNTTDKGAVNSVKRFLENAGADYDGI